MLPSHLGGCQQAMVALACGARHTCAVGGMGQLFCWGWSLHGQCGQGRAVVTVPCPQVVGGNAWICSVGHVQLAGTSDAVFKGADSLNHQEASGMIDISCRSFKCLQL